MNEEIKSESLLDGDFSCETTEDWEMKEDKRGYCYQCQYWDGFLNYCDYYKIMLNGLGTEPTCSNEELIMK